MIYTLIIGLPVFLALLSDKTKGSLSGIFAVCAMVVPCFFAAVRDSTVGTDVMVYGIWTYNAATVQSLTSFMEGSADTAAPGINFVSWLFAHLGSFEFFLGGIQALTVCPVYLYARHRYPRCTWPAMAIYMLLLFPVSLNAMKQMIAVSMCVLAFEFVERRKPLLFVAYIVAIAMLFHQTAVVMLVVYPIARLMYSAGNQNSAFFGRGQKLVVGFIILLLFGFTFYFGDVLIDAIAPLKQSYSYQVQAQGDRLNYSALVMAVALTLIYIGSRVEKGVQQTKLAQEEMLLAATSVVGFLAFQMNMIASSLLRFAYYFVAFAPLYASSLLADKSRAKCQIALSILLLLFIFYFVQVYVINGGNAVFPYTSAILGVA